MIQSLLRNREAVDFCSALDIQLTRDRLSDEDLRELQAPVAILEPFIASTLRLEGKASYLWDVIPKIDFLCGVCRYDIALNSCLVVN